MEILWILQPWTWATSFDLWAVSLILCEPFLVDLPNIKPHKYDTTPQIYIHHIPNTGTKLFIYTKTFILNHTLWYQSTKTLEKHYSSNTRLSYRLEATSFMYFDIPFLVTMNFYHALLQMFYGYWLWSGFIELYCLSYWNALELDSFLCVDQIRGQTISMVKLGQCVPWIQ